MISNPRNSAEALRLEILATAQRQCQECIQQARQRAAEIRARAVSDAAARRAERLEMAGAEAERIAARARAAVPIEVGRLRRARIEGLLESIHRTVAQRLESLEAMDYRGTLLRLGAQAVPGMSGGTFVLRLAVPDCERFGAGLVAELAQHLGMPESAFKLLADPAIKGGGIIIENATGAEVWDNRFTARLERLWPELRRQIALSAKLLPESGAHGATS